MDSNDALDAIEIEPFDSLPVDVPVTGAVRTKKIKPGSPLSIRIMSVFPGDSDHDRGGSAILTSAVRSPMLHDAAPLAMHYLYKSVPYGSLLGSRADEPGSDVIYYSPAELSAELDVTVRLAFDRFDRDTFDSWVDAAATAAALPVFAVSGPTGAAWIAVAQNAAKLVTRVADKAIDGDNDRVMTWRVNLSSPSLDLTKSGFVLLYPDGNKLIPANPGNQADEVISTDGSFSRAGDQFEVRNGKLCWAGTDDVVLTGDSYVLVFINGEKIRELDGWASAAVSANLAEKFLNADKVGADDAIAAFKLFNDVRWLREIGTIDRDAAALAKEKDSAEKTKKLKELETRREAARKNIQDDAVRELYEKAASATATD